MQEELIRQAYWAPLYYRPAIVTSGPRVRGVGDSPFSDYTWDVYRWHPDS